MCVRSSEMVTSFNVLPLNGGKNDLLRDWFRISTKKTCFRWNLNIPLLFDFMPHLIVDVVKTN